MRNLLLLFGLLFLAIPLSANVAQPGIWSSGGAANYSLLFPGDSAFYNKIQMQKERVLVQLYPGFAVVKGTYWMLNTSSDTIHMHAGYPVNNAFEFEPTSRKTTIFFDSLYALRVKADTQQIILHHDSVQVYNEFQQWYTWENTFNPGVTTKIEIYFIVNTNNSRRVEGYSKSFENTFVYLLESGASWKPPIVDGEIIVQLMDELSIEKVHGIAPDITFGQNAENKILYWHFTNLIPDKFGKDNIVITYGKQLGSFNFASVVSFADNYFLEIDKLALLDPTSMVFRPTAHGDPYSTNDIPDASVLWKIIVPGFALFALAVVGLWFLFRKKKS